MIRIYWAVAHVGGPEPEWASDEGWEHCGYTTNDDGEPELDCCGNTVANWRVRDPKPEDAALVYDFVTGDGQYPLSSEDELREYCDGLAEDVTDVVLTIYREAVRVAKISLCKERNNLRIESAATALRAFSEREMSKDRIVFLDETALVLLTHGCCEDFGVDRLLRVPRDYAGAYQAWARSWRQAWEKAVWEGVQAFPGRYHVEGVQWHNRMYEVGAEVPYVEVNDVGC